jgi:lysozyme
MTLEDQLILHEGLRLVVYDDATGEPLKPGKILIGYPTIGVGRNLITNGLTKYEAYSLLDHDIMTAQIELKNFLPFFYGLSEIRQRVLIDMCFNLGLAGLKKFTATLAAIKGGDYVTASTQMMKSKWAGQVGIRAKRLSFMMANNRYPTDKELEQW